MCREERLNLQSIVYLETKTWFEKSFWLNFENHIFKVHASTKPVNPETPCSLKGLQHWINFMTRSCSCFHRTLNIFALKLVLGRCSNIGHQVACARARGCISAKSTSTWMKTSKSPRRKESPRWMHLPNHATCLQLSTPAFDWRIFDKDVCFEVGGRGGDGGSIHKMEN